MQATPGITINGPNPFRFYRPWRGSVVLINSSLGFHGEVFAGKMTR
jgi:hypothetical protein